MAKGRDINQTEINLLNFGKEKAELLKKKIQEKNKEEISKYSFIPSVLQNKNKPREKQNMNQKLQDLGYGNTNNKSNYQVHTKLYEYAERQKRALERVRAEPECNFTPDLRASNKSRLVLFQKLILSRHFTKIKI